jgi:DNA-directed RNA polymerase subunit beta'
LAETHEKKLHSRWLIPVGIGFKGLTHCSSQHKIIPFKTKKKNLFEGEMRDILFHHIELIDSYISKNFYNISEQSSFIGFNDS